MRRLAVVGLVVAALLAAVCGDKDEPLGPIGSVPQGTTTTNPYAVPEVIDEAYVNRVLAGLDQALGDAVRSMVSTKNIATEQLRAIYLGNILDITVSLFEDDQRREFEDYSLVPGNQISTVTSLLSVSVECVFAAIDRDYSQVARNPTGTPIGQWVALQRSSRPPDNLNPTTWVLIYDGFERGKVQPADPCPA